MTHSAYLQGLSSLKRSLSEPQTLDDVWQSRPLLWQELGWEKPQLKLWLRCQPGMQIKEATGENPSYSITSQNADNGQNLGEIIAKILQGVGKPIPIAQLKNKLPAGIMATEPMLKTAINEHPHLSLTGPMVRLI